MSSEDSGTRHSMERLKSFFYLPFGRYEGGRRAEYPADEVMVGRERERATLLNHLFSYGRRGSYLVTGHRGCGKTSFVNHCLTEYKDDVYRRYLQRNVGRAFLWDRIGQCLLALLLITTGVLLSELLGRLVVPGPPSPDGTWIADPLGLSLVLAAALVLVLSYPLFAAYSTIRDALFLTDPPNAMAVPQKSSSAPGEAIRAILKSMRSQSWAPMATLTLFVLLAGYVVDIADKSAGVTYCVAPAVLSAALGLFFLLTNCLSVVGVSVPAGPSGDPSISVDDRRKTKRTLPSRLAPLITLVATLVFISMATSAPGLLNTPFLLTVASGFFAGGLACRFTLLRLLRRSLSTSKEEGESPPIEETLKRGETWHFAGAALLALFSIASWRWGHEVEIILGLSVLPSGPTDLLTLDDAIRQAWLSRATTVALGLALTTVVARVVLNRNWSFRLPPKDRLENKSSLRLHPQATPLFLLRAATLTVFGIQLLHPLARLVSPGSSHSMFGTLRPDLLWIGCYFLLLLAFTAIEYEWIVRPFANLREDYSLHSSLDDPSRRAAVGDSSFTNNENEGGVATNPPAFNPGGDTEPSESAPTANPADVYRYSEVRHRQARLARQTVFWKVATVWLPVLQVPVNLGFDQLDQRLVIESMLDGLRTAYQRAFLHWSSTFTAISRGLLLLGLLVMAIYVGDHLFGLKGYAPSTREGICLEEISTENVTFERSGGEVRFEAQSYGSEVESTGATNLPAPSRLLCAVGGESLASVFYWSPIRQGPPPDPDADGLLKLFLSGGEYGRSHYYDLRIYHLLVFLGLLFTTNRILRRAQVPSYRQIYDRMSAMLANLSSTIRDETHPPSTLLGRWLGNLWHPEVIRQTESAPFDPRTVELNFLRILQDMQDPSIQVPLGAKGRISLPIPEIIFFFDELDKVGVDWMPRSELPLSRPDAEQPLDRERERSRALHKLFADLKNTISSGRARFLFVGGRNLHDEWLADQTARRPLLTSIFDLEIYLPSLLIVEEADAGLPLAMVEDSPVYSLLGIEAFLSRQLFRAHLLHRRHLLKRTGPWLSVWREELRPTSYVQVPEMRASRQGDSSSTSEFQWPSLKDISSGWSERMGESPADFYPELLQFLAYRSKGNVKRLRELLETFLVPVGRLKIVDDSTFHEYRADHYLVFQSEDIFRIQLIADVYRQLAPILAPRLEQRDDKIPQAVLALADFLMKFHRRGFSWSNLERVDELVDIHRAPDLRHVMQQIIRRWSDRFLHRIRNGMYDFRMTSETARELEYISRGSEQELAAFNFTLDESQILKTVYRSRIEELGDENGEEFITGLAELHKFDEEYELARAYFKRSIHALDKRFRLSVRRLDTLNPVSDALLDSPPGARATRALLTWGIARLRQMLQIGMTYERTQNFETALAQYRESRNLSANLIRALLNWLEQAKKLSLGDDPTRGTESGISVPPFTFEEGLSLLHQRLHQEFLSNLKQLNLLFQPIFAEAWASEKLSSNVDTAPAMVESELWKLREALPFVNSAKFVDHEFAPGDDPPAFAIRHSNFALILAELHNKAGDLLFFKGRQLVSWDRVKSWIDSPRLETDGYAEGYLPRAIYHYNLALHDLRRYTTYRLATSALKFGHPEEGVRTVESEGWSDYVLRSTAGSLADLADAYLGTFSMTRLLVSQQQPGAVEVPTKSLELWNPEASLKEAYDQVVGWLEGQPAETSDPIWTTHLRAMVPGLHIRRHGLGDWLGRPVGSRGRSRTGFLLTYKATSLPAASGFPRFNDYERVFAMLTLSLCSARMLHRGGYFEAAGKQYLRVATITNHLLWMRAGLCAIVRQIKPSASLVERLKSENILSARALRCSYPFAANLLHYGKLALRNANESFQHARPPIASAKDSLGEPLRSGLRIPASALTLACSLLMVADLETPQTGEGINRSLPLGVLDKLDPAVQATQDSLHGLIKEWTAQQCEAPADLREVLHQSLAQRRYPCLNRLNALKVLVDHALLDEQEPVPHTESEGDLAELLRLNRHFDSPFHFTPQQVGTTLAWRHLMGSGTDSDSAHRRSQALEALYKSQQMFTLRLEYYSAIQGLFYLYDDFNDRSIHCNQALQMASVEATTFLIRLLEAETTS